MSNKIKRSRSHQFAVRLSDSELSLWNKKQTVSGLGKTEYFIRLLKGSVIKVYCFDEALKILFHQLRKIGVNLNQVAFLANSGYTYQAAQELHSIQGAYFEVMERLKKFLDHPLLNAYMVRSEETDTFPETNPLVGE